MTSLLIPISLMALAAAPQAPAPDESPATTIESALIEYACGRQTGDVRDACLKGQLLSMRTTFGRDLRRLSANERKMIDSACNMLHETDYVPCVSRQLAELAKRRPKPAAPPPAAAVAAPPAAPANPEAPAPAGVSPIVWIGAAVVVALAGGAGAFLVLKGRRRTSVTCRGCGGQVEGPGDLCQKCRREAADALRRAAAERAGQERAQDGQQRRLREQEEEQQRQKARQAEEDEARRRQQEDARQREEAARRQREEARQQSQAAAASADVFDPHAVLGVPRDASPEAIQTAYETARAKYGPDQVEFLSTELQAHYKTKAESIERAFRQLVEKG